jgi:hypothetical protein
MPEFAPAWIVACYQDKRSFNAGPAQTVKAFFQQTLAEAACPIIWINRQVIDISPASVMTA